MQAVREEPRKKINMTKAILKKEELDLKKNTKKYHWDVDK